MRRKHCNCRVFALNLHRLATLAWEMRNTLTASLNHSQLTIPVVTLISDHSVRDLISDEGTCNN